MPVINIKNRRELKNKKINLPCMTTWEIYFVLFYLFRNRLSKNLIKNSIIILFYRKFELFLQRK